jgi:DNA-binding FrmR family transcriptional regulator
MENFDQKIISRLHRMEGQVRGIENMWREKKPYSQIIQQLEALRSATNQLTAQLIEEKFCSSERELKDDDIAYLKRFIGGK